MKMICDVPNEVIKSVRMGTWCGSSVVEKMIANGTPLPKGHGELVDRNAINERFYSIYNDAINCSNQPSDKYLLDKLSMCLDTAPTIIEADKE